MTPVAGRVCIGFRVVEGLSELRHPGIIGDTSSAQANKAHFGLEARCVSFLLSYAFSMNARSSLPISLAPIAARSGVFICEKARVGGQEHKRGLTQI